MQIGDLVRILPGHPSRMGGKVGVVTDTTYNRRMVEVFVEGQKINILWLDLKVLND